MITSQRQNHAQWYIFLLINCIGCSLTSGVIIETEHGKVRGDVQLSENGRNYLSFKKVPFGKPPTGILRFNVSLPVDDWTDVYDATAYPEPCAQAALGYDEGVEDCLYMSVYSPKVEDSEKKNKDVLLPVLVWLHGGAFVIGSSEMYDPRYIMDKNIILVVPQYRLGILGYFSTRSKYAFGNYGTLDQILALKWIQSNIEKFGGDPNAVTLAGDCAGGVSAIYHMISPLSKGLFHRVISFSGSPLTPWAVHPNEARISLLMANSLVCPHHDLAFLTDCFQRKSLQDLLGTQKMYLESRDILIGNSKFSPAIQRAVPIPKSKVVLPKHPLEHLLTGNYTHVPVLLSVTKDVGSYLIDMSLYDFILMKMEEKPGYLKTFLEILLPELSLYSPELEEKRFKKYYLPQWDRKTLPEIIPGLTKLLGDTMFNAGIFNLAKILSTEIDVKMLRFDYELGPKLFDIRNPNASLGPPIPDNTVSHGDELFSIFPQKSQILNTEQKKMTTKMLTIIDNFVYGREPIEGWSPFTRTALETTIVNAEGNFELNKRFPGDETMLDYIYQSQHFEVLKDLIRRGKHKAELLVKEEL